MRWYEYKMETDDLYAPDDLKAKLLAMTDQLTEEEKVQARKDALKAYQEEELRKIQQRRSRPKPAAKTQANPSERSLFDF